MRYLKIIYKAIKNTIDSIKQQIEFNRALSFIKKDDPLTKMEMEICKVISKYTQDSPSKIFRNIKREISSDGRINININWGGSLEGQ